MSLLTNVIEHSLDDGYAQAAARKRAQGADGLPRPVRARLGLAAGLVLAALVVTVGAAQAQVSAPVVAKERQELIDRIEAETRQADDLHDQVDKLSDDVEGRQRKALDQGSAAEADLVSLLAGATAVHGPGVKLVVDDAEDAGNGSGSGRQSSDFSDTGRVRDRDVQRIVNGLWAAGAEGVSVNGQRLSALSAIRHAGDAILVDNKPLVPPYTLLALGGRKLSERFQNGLDGRYLYQLHKDYGIRNAITAQDDVRLPAAPSLTVRTADPLASGKGTE
jgi:uncharacterized protein YlxW (UPF0749 family)